MHVGKTGREKAIKQKLCIAGSSDEQTRNAETMKDLKEKQIHLVSVTWSIIADLFPFLVLLLNEIFWLQKPSSQLIRNP